MIGFPFQIVACGILPQFAEVGEAAPNTSLCTCINGGDGAWQITADDPTLSPGNCLLFLTPGSASNVEGGVSFGQSSQVGNGFFVNAYRNVGEGEDPPGEPFAVEIQFMIVRFPPQNNGDAI